MSWLLVMAAIGVYLTDGGFRQSEAKPFIYPVKRAQLMSKGNAYRMLGISGVITTVPGDHLSLHPRIISRWQFVPMGAEAPI